MTAPTLHPPTHLCGRCRQDVRTERGTDDLGFGYSRDTDNGTPDPPVPDGVELIFLTGRTPRGAR
jgi:hypothetical protein